MSEKKEKKDHKMKLIAEEENFQAVAEEMAKSIRKMYEDRDKKVISAKEHLVEQLKVTTDKYCTANGVMHALNVIRDVYGDKDRLDLEEEIELAKDVTSSMAVSVHQLCEKAEEMDPEKFGSLCDGFWNPNFSTTAAGPKSLVIELLHLDLCQGVGSAADDVIDFINHADDEIDKAKLNLIAYCQDHDIDFDKLCGEED